MYVCVYIGIAFHYVHEILIKTKMKDKNTFK